MRPSRRALAWALVLGLAACRTTKAVEAPGEGFLGALELPGVGPVRYSPAELSGQVVLVTFFATWCFPCVAEIPTLQALQRDYGPRGFRVVAVGMDLDGKRVLAPFAEHYELNYPVLLASESIIAGQSAFGPIRSMPMAVILDRQGRAVSAWQGVASHEDVAKEVEKALGK
ncbi:TlpA family protein disulfide reductase [Hyalangium rubrum]|uniref:TlpA disulfide reductase family protein n=1 Tax=Hyalangium rubrum TaxID=3103134 RepID=A0ABU5HDY8_9BACT|nr:TlpA disulfide reductase family protein [Hyalangium sp. s54d21]MDY7231481.1 TlpA disulfide reductase family protein [Hyalangium sp. s54d21]